MSDSLPGHSPWFHYNEVNSTTEEFYFVGKNAVVQGDHGYDKNTHTYTRSITANDSPSFRVPVQDLNKTINGNNHPNLVKVKLETDFTLDVASATTDAILEGAEIYTRMATADWNINASGDIGAQAARWPWTGLDGITGVHPPASKNWEAPNNGGTQIEIPDKQARTEANQQVFK